MSIVPIPAVNGVVFNEAREVLMTRRSPKVREPGKWCLPGGHLDGGEDWRTAMRREMKEETGLTVISDALFGIYSDPKLTVTTELLPGGYHGQFIVAAFLITEYEGELIPNDEVDLWGWFNVNELPTPILKSHPIRALDAFQFNGNVFVR